MIVADMITIGSTSSLFDFLQNFDVIVCVGVIVILLHIFVSIYRREVIPLLLFG
jgi:lipoprotein signal peptidase